MTNKTQLKGVDIYILVDNEAESEQFLKDFGLAIGIVAHYPKGDIHTIFDTCCHGQTVLSNMQKLNLNVADINYIVLSHKHFDHTDGLIEILQAKDDWVPVLHGKNFFQPSICLEPYLWHLTRVPFVKSKIAEFKGMPTEIWQPTEFAPGLFVSGRIAFLTDFEVPSPPAFRLIPPMMLQDEIEEEMSLVINIKNELVIVSGCSHRGIVNIAKNAISSTGISTVRAIVGGLHLGDREQRITRTIEGLDRLGVKKFHIGHCTDDKAIVKFKEKFGNRVNRTQSGMRITF